jgi:hypothetical protein
MINEKKRKRCRCAMNDLLEGKKKKINSCCCTCFSPTCDKYPRVISIINGEEIVTYHIHFSSPTRLLGTG